MSPEEIAEKARRGGLTLAFDTNALFGERSLFGVCNGVARYNERLAQRGLSPIRLVVCTVAHAEKLFDLKQQYRGTFDQDVILRGLQRKGLVIQPFDGKHAMETAVRLGELHPTTAEWHAAKKKRCLECLAPEGDGRSRHRAGLRGHGRLAHRRACPVGGRRPCHGR